MKKLAVITIVVIIILFSFSVTVLSAEVYSKNKPEFTEGLALKFAKMALNCIEKEYPNKPSHVLNNKNEALPPIKFHPAFYGCFDWHSAVHGHWMLVKVMKTFPEIKSGEKIRKALKRNITVKNIETEINYLNQKNRKSFERTYGWSWLLKLTEELYTWDDQDGKEMYKSIKPLAEKIVRSYLDFLPKQTYPIRTGVHPNTAFGLLFAYDYALTLNNKELLDLIKSKSIEYFGNDTKCPDSWEPGGEDFFSPCLMEALLMTKILNKDKFLIWFEKFLPNLKHSKLLVPAIVSDRSDGKLSHLDGLNLSRVWCFADIRKLVPKNSRLNELLTESIKIHLKTALDNINSGFYAGEHWLGSFAVYAFSRL